MPLSNGTIAPAVSAAGIDRSALSNWVAFTVIQSTSTGGTCEVRSMGTLKLPNGLSSCSWRGYCSRASGRTTIVTGAPVFARQAPIRPPTPPGPRIACFMHWHYATAARRASPPRRSYTNASVMTDEKRSRTLLWIVIGGGAFFLFVLAVFALVYVTLHTGKDASLTSFGDKIAVVDLDGVILSPNPVVQQLKKFADDDSVKAIILHVNSPGGGVAASEEIYREVKRIRDDKKKRIVASIETVGASGAYYVSSATNKISADNGSVVGSIGVIAHSRYDPRRTGIPAGHDR